MYDTWRTKFGLQMYLSILNMKETLLTVLCTLKNQKTSFYRLVTEVCFYQERKKIFN